jgi:hypothetical protein
MIWKECDAIYFILIKYLSSKCHYPPKSPTFNEYNVKHLAFSGFELKKLELNLWQFKTSVKLLNMD